MNERRRPRFLKPSDQPTTSVASNAPCMQDRAGPELSDDVTSVHNNPYASLSIQQQRSRLPIFKYQTCVIVGETGCGKSTQVPQYLLETGWSDAGRQVCVTQPRRVAAVTLANRVAEERMCILGHDVGYCVRFDDCTTDETKIKYVTDGILIREMMADPLLTAYSVVMVDEAHERSINTDLICALLRKIAVKRHDLRIIISSATLDAELFRDYFNLNNTGDASKDTAVALSVEGRMHPVQIFFAKNPVADYIKSTVELTMIIHKHEAHGDILSFLTGQDEVEQACAMLKDAAKTLVKTDYDKLWVLPMYGALPAKDQFKVFDSAPAGTRKVIVATNIAEASVTIPGVAYVIDSGFVKLRALNKTTALESLMTVSVSQASAEQRAGRAGRIRAGKCYRLYPESEFDKLRQDTVPEMQRSHLAPVILQLKALGIENRPSSFAMIRGLELLYALGAIDKNGHLTEIGEKMAEMPLPPIHSKILLSSGDFECTDEILSILAMLQIQDVFMFPLGQKHRAEVSKRRFAVEEGDHLMLLNVFAGFEQARRSQKWCSDHFINYRGMMRAIEIRNQLERLAKRFKVPMLSSRGFIGDNEKVRRCLCAGLFPNAAHIGPDNIYRTVRENYTLKVYQGSAIMYRKNFPKWVIFNEILSDSMRDVTVIDPEWLYELAPHFYEFGTNNELASKKRKRITKANESDSETESDKSSDGDGVLTKFDFFSTFHEQIKI